MKLSLKHKLLPLVIWLSLSVGQMYAQDTYVMGVEDIDYLPYYQTINGEYSGFARELFDEFARQADINIVYKPLPVKRLYRDFYAKRIDLKFPDNPDWGVTVRSRHNIAYSYPFLPAIDGLLVRKDRDQISVEQLKSITAVLGFYPNLGFEDRIKDKTIVFEKSHSVEGALMQVLEGRTDGVFMNVAVANYHLDKMNKNGSMVLANRLPTRQSSQSFSSIKHPEVIAAFDNFLLNNQTFVDQLASKYKLEWKTPIKE